uniref:Uncharacterized protein n=1 Tax=Arundo donax TaxID=35708 RepID=A0A0A8YLW5_ARUDO
MHLGDSVSRERTR